MSCDENVSTFLLASNALTYIQVEEKEETGEASLHDKKITLILYHALPHNPCQSNSVTNIQAHTSSEVIHLKK